MESEDTPIAVEEGIRWWQPLREVVSFLVHFVVGTIIFVLLGFFAVALFTFTEWLSSFTKSLIVQKGLILVEYATFGTDIILYLIFLVGTIRKFGKSLFFLKD